MIKHAKKNLSTTPDYKTPSVASIYYYEKYSGDEATSQVLKA
jgi:hypothetical protein